MKHIVFFSSGGPGNFATALEFCAMHPDTARVISLVTDRPAIPAITLAERQGIEVRQFSFCSPIADEAARRRDCGPILGYLKELEQRVGRIDLIVLAFRKILSGDILRSYAGRIINVHPADLTVHDTATRQRRYVGIDGLHLSLHDGNQESRTSIHFVDAGIDTGELLCVGPYVPFLESALSRATVSAHEAVQKQHSDKPALLRALHLLLCERGCPRPILMRDTQ